MLKWQITSTEPKYVNTNLLWCLKRRTFISVGALKWHSMHVLVMAPRHTIQTQSWLGVVLSIGFGRHTGSNNYYYWCAAFDKTHTRYTTLDERYTTMLSRWHLESSQIKCNACSSSREPGAWKPFHNVRWMELISLWNGLRKYANPTPNPLGRREFIQMLIVLIHIFVLFCFD